jgi:hypothetical protein
MSPSATTIKTDIARTAHDREAASFAGQEDARFIAPNVCQSRLETSSPRKAKALAREQSPLRYLPSQTRKGVEQVPVPAALTELSRISSKGILAPRMTGFQYHFGVHLDAFGSRHG